MEHASEVWWTGGKAACNTWKKFKRTLAEHWWVGVAVAGVVGRSGLEEPGGEKGRKEIIIGWRLQKMNEDRLVRKAVALLNDCCGRWVEYCELKRKFEVEGELEVVGLCATRRNCVWDVHVEG